MSKINYKFKLTPGISDTLVLCCALTAVGCVWVDHARSKNVKITTGTVRGYLVHYRDGEYFAFLGIPYASPPTLDSRFKAPQPPQAWTDIFHANRTVRCPQNGIGDEDCLVVNVFTPKMIKELVPVLVYIHGGSFLEGHGKTKGVGPLIKQNVIVVTLNYRLGVLGFLCLGIAEAPGNAGLKDQVAALQWVQTNIVNFKGDPDQVTLYGTSAGGAAVSLHMLSKMSEGLFQRAIVESASAISVSSIDAEPISTAMKFISRLDYPELVLQNLTTLVKFLQGESADLLSTVNTEFQNSLTDGTYGFAPCLENELETESLISRPPYQTLRDNNYNKIPIMFLYASLEGLYLEILQYHYHYFKHKMDENFMNFLPGNLVFHRKETKEIVSRDIRDYYFGRETVSSSNIIQYLNYFGDYIVMHGLLNAAETLARDGVAVYLMEFAYKGNMGKFEKLYKNLTVSGHGDAVKHVILEKTIRTADDQLAVGRFSKLIGNFVNFGNPTPSQTSLLPRLWPPCLPAKLVGFRMDQGFEVFDVYKDPVLDRKMFWDTLYRRYRRRVGPVAPELYQNYSNLKLLLQNHVFRVDPHGNQCRVSSRLLHVFIVFVVNLLL